MAPSSYSWSSVVSSDQMPNGSCELDHSAWPELTGFLVQAERSNVHACVADSSWRFMVTSRFICTPQQVAHCAAVTFLPATAAPPGTPVLVRLGAIIVTNRTGIITRPSGG